MAQYSQTPKFWSNTIKKLVWACIGNDLNFLRTKQKQNHVFTINLNNKAHSYYSYNNYRIQHHYVHETRVILRQHYGLLIFNLNFAQFLSRWPPDFWLRVNKNVKCWEKHINQKFKHKLQVLHTSKQLLHTKGTFP